MNNIEFVLETLKDKKNKFTGDFFIPKAWNYFGFKDFKEVMGRYGEISVNPYEFFSQCLENLLDNCIQENTKRLSSNDAVNMEDSVIYGLFPRMFTAWNHYNENICSGTFLKATCLLPYLKRMGVNVIYLLPIFKYSLIHKKGETGSPYSIKDIYQIDENLHDGLLGNLDSSVLEKEFKSFVEACHLLGMKVMIDFVFRTVARDSDLILEHPDWFYWIRSDAKSCFCAPRIGSIKPQTVVSEKLIKKIYKDKVTCDYLKQFTLSPKDIDEKKWDKLIKKHKDTGRNLLELIEESMGITTAPGFSDVINDSQPPWSDVTYLKFYFDNHEKAAPYLKDGQAPYVLFDVAKLSLFKWKDPNNELWDYTVNVIPYYQQKFGIDGARIDMGHALPTELNKEIIRKTKEINPNFLLWSEEFNSLNSQKALDDGFQFMTGSLWFDYKNIEKQGFYKGVLEPLLKSSLPVTGALESPDTPRAAYNYKNPKNLEFMAIINNFMPNVVPMLNNGMEIMEIQPMNLGLDNTEAGRFVLPESDPMYGKLAFFDNYKLHWNNDSWLTMPDFLEKAFLLRSRFKKIVGNKDNFIYLKSMEKNKKLLILCYKIHDTDDCLVILGNKSHKESSLVDLTEQLPDIAKSGGKIEIVYMERHFYNKTLAADEKILLQPKDVIVGIISSTF
jgi:glycosidase